MKKLILSITAITLLTINVKAQAPDFGFENWSAIPFNTTVDPTGWASLNALNVVGTPQSVFKETAAPAAGTITAQVTTVKVTGASIPNPNRPGKNLDTAGILVVGKVQVTPSAKLIYGFSMPGAFPRPSTLSFQSKYTPTGSDSAFVVAFLTHWNGTKRDTIASGKYATGANTGAGPYALNSLTMNYKSAFSNVMPDSEQIFISSSIYSHGGAQLGSAFYVDALAWSGYTSVNEIAGVENNVSVFPNPANDQINFNSSVNVSAVEITDITGRLTGAYKMVDNKLTIQTSSFVPGTYLYTMLNDKKEVMNRGKFEVTK